VASYPPPPPPPPPPGYGAAPQYGGYSPGRSTHGKAIAALICGIAAFVVCPLTAIAAVILGPQAKREIAAEPDRYEGAGLAQAGLIIGWVAIAFLVLTVLLIIVLVIVGVSTGSSSAVNESLASLRR
jgi:ABC-type Fe3+ transport system permease subunit